MFIDHVAYPALLDYLPDVEWTYFLESPLVYSQWRSFEKDLTGKAVSRSNRNKIITISNYDFRSDDVSRTTLVVVMESNSLGR